MPSWLITLMSRIATSGFFAIIATRRGMITGGFGILLVGSLFGSIPLVLIGAFTILWASAKLDQEKDKPTPTRSVSEGPDK